MATTENLGAELLLLGHFRSAFAHFPLLPLSVWVLRASCNPSSPGPASLGISSHDHLEVGVLPSGSAPESPQLSQAPTPRVNRLWLHLSLVPSWASASSLLHKLLLLFLVFQRVMRSDFHSLAMQMSSLQLDSWAPHAFNAFAGYSQYTALHLCWSGTQCSPPSLRTIITEGLWRSM